MSGKEFLCRVVLRIKADSADDAAIEANSAINWLKYDRQDMSVESCEILTGEVAADDHQEV